MKSTTFLLVLLLMATGLPAAHAEAPPGAPVTRTAEITMELFTEGFVEPQSARVTIAFDLAQDGAGQGDARGRLHQILSALTPNLPNVAWRFTRFERLVDPAGLERWHMLAEARLPEKELGGLADKVKNASKPGLQARVAAVDFSPTVAEQEVAFAGLRGNLYGDIQGELNRLKTAFPDRAYGVKSITFHRLEGPAVAPPPQRALTPEQAEQPVEAGPAISRHLGLSATVVLAVGA